MPIVMSRSANVLEVGTTTIGCHCYNYLWMEWKFEGLWIVACSRHRLLGDNPKLFDQKVKGMSA